MGWKCKGDEIRLSNLDENNNCWLLYLLNLKYIENHDYALHINIIITHYVMNLMPIFKWKNVYLTKYRLSFDKFLLSFILLWVESARVKMIRPSKRKKTKLIRITVCISKKHYIFNVQLYLCLYHRLCLLFILLWGESARVTTIWSSKMEWTSSTLAKITV